MIKESILIVFAKIFGLLLSIFSIMLYAETYKSPWHLLLWIPITFGYFLWFSDIIETHMDLKRLRKELRDQKGGIK